MRELSHPCPGDAVSAISADPDEHVPDRHHHRRADAPRRRLTRFALHQHLRAVARHRVGRGRAHVRAADGGPPSGQGRRSRRDRLEHRRRAARVAHARRAPYGLASELTVSRHGIITRTGDRRGVVRFVLVAGGSLLLDDEREILGFTHDLSIHGVGLLLEGEPRRSERAAGSRCGTRSGCCCRARPCAWCTRARRGRRAWRASASPSTTRAASPARRPPALAARLDLRRRRRGGRRAHARSRQVPPASGSRTRSPARQAPRPSSRAC